MAADPPIPRVSVAIPAWKRHEIFPRTIQSVLDQTIADWELVVSDDETVDNPNRAFALDLAKRDPRVRLVINGEPHGQVPNTNNAIAHCRAPWVKLLHNDDILEPDCLEECLRAVSLCPNAVLVSCLKREFRWGVLFPWRAKEQRLPRIQVIPQRLVHLAMYLQDVNVGVPSELMLRRDIFEMGVRFILRPEITSNVDADWASDLLKRGDLLLLNRPLVQWRQGEHESITRTMTEEAYFKELDFLRRRFHANIDPALHAPSLKVADGLTRLIRAFRALSLREPRRALTLMASVPYPRSWWLVFRWFLRRWNPALSIVPRETVER